MEEGHQANEYLRHEGGQYQAAFRVESVCVHPYPGWRPSRRGTDPWLTYKALQGKNPNHRYSFAG
jgi:hypothetical protein